MAQQDYAGLLTGLDTRPINPMQGLNREGRMAARAQGFADKMAGGLLRAAGQDPRTAQQQANAAISSLNLDTNDKVEQQKNVDILRKVDPQRAQQLAQMYQQKNQRLAQTQGLIDTATKLGLTNTVELLQSGGSIEDAAKSIYDEQQRQTINKGGRQGKLAVAQSKNASPKLIAKIKNGQFDEMSDELFIEQLEGKKATIKAFTNAQGEVQSRRVDDSANVWNPATSKWESPMDLGLRPAPVVTKQISAADGITSKLTGKMTDNFLELNAQAQTAEKILRINRDSMEVLDKGIVSGFTAPIQLEVMRIGKAMGILPEDMEDKVAATELFMISRAKQVLPLIKALGSGTAISDKDREFIEKVVAGNIALDEKTIREVIRIESQVAMDAINANNSALDTLNRVEGTKLDNSVYQSLYIQPPAMSITQQGYSTGAQSYLNRIK